MKNKLKMICVLMLFIVSMVASSVAVFGAELQDRQSFDSVRDIKVGVEVNDVRLNQNVDRKNIEKTDELDVLVTLQFLRKAAATSNPASLGGVVVEATLTSDGHNNDRISEVSKEFTAKMGDIYDERFDLELPARMEQGVYSLKIRVDTNTNSKTYFYKLRIDATDHLLEVRDIILSPENTVKAGRTLLVSARVKNRGENDEEDVKVKASIPELGVSASDFIDEVDKEDCTSDDCDDSITSGTLYLRIPEDAETGDYDVVVEVTFEDGDSEITETETIHVLGVEGQEVIGSDSGKTIISIGPETQDVTKGVAALYPVTLTNTGKSSITYVVDVDGADWGTFQVSPSNVVVLDAGESKSVYVYATASEGATAGEQMFSVSVTSGDKVLEQVPLKANVGESASAGSSAWSKVKRALEIGLIVLVVLLVILGLIIGFNKLKGDDEDQEKDDGQTYY
ncbi:MAG: hypothetical protein QF824_05160, partial [Candidatus Woesearchaeota archaeon]|nr:hypothetical protein [Candidatus Woesearchaeota archaeon]